MGRKKLPTWSQIKARLSYLEKDDLLNVIRDLHHLNQDNKVFLASCLMLDDAEGLVEPYRRAIRREFNPDRGLPGLNIRAARKALTDFKKASANRRVVADLMVYYVEQGVVCTLEYGDIHEGFYNSLGSVFREAIALISGIGDAELIEEFRPRLKRIVADTGGIGWGFHDFLADVYENEYPSEW
jgi:hypothetical protein